MGSTLTFVKATTAEGFGCGIAAAATTSERPRSLCIGTLLLRRILLRSRPLTVAATFQSDASVQGAEAQGSYMKDSYV